MDESRKLGKDLKSLNLTFLSLIPKENGADSLGNFRPIALCNVIFKIITKVISNGIKPLLPPLISPEKSEYVEGGKSLMV